ncbi:MAG TPA: lamin tail domain-containing protein [Pyrinomonadaceae bacterium]|nr:lamin tail domain-containing protein [Pyrinomonadaceae bacterium]
MNSISRPRGFVVAALLCLSVTAPDASAQEGLPGGKRGKSAATAHAGRGVEPAVVAARPLIISEFRLNGTGGALDEFIEIYNASNAPHTVNSSDGSNTGYAVAASDGDLRFTIPQNTVIPARGHYLGCNSLGYSLSSLPSGNDGQFATTANCDATYTQNIENGEDPDGAGGNPPLPRRGIALFSTANSANFNTGTRLDAVGPTAEANTLYKEGAGVRNLSHFSTAHSYVRRLPGGCIGTDPDTVDANCTNPTAVINTPAASSGHPRDTDNNRDDFIFVDTNGTPQSPEGTQQRLGAPGPENSTSPINRSANFPSSLVFPCVNSHTEPNTKREPPSNPSGDPSPRSRGTFEIRRKFTNKTGGNVSRLRFRVVDISTFPAPSGVADLRVISSENSLEANPCAGGTITVRGTTLEQAAAAEAQPSGGGFNSTLSAGTVTIGTQLANGASIDLRFLFGVEQAGAFRFFIVVEALP